MTVSIVAYGGGTNSTALLCGMVEREEPPPHVILMGDTGGEWPHTYRHREIVNEWLLRVGYPPVQMLRRSRRDKSWVPLEDECVSKNMLPSIAYGYKSCSQKYKIEPQDKFCNNDPRLREEWAAGRLITKYIGYDFGEVRRARFGQDGKYKFRYPLIDWEWKREDCVAAIQRHGLPLPGKSACFFCPSSRKPDIEGLRDRHPELLERALRMEAGAKLTKVKGLGRRFAWRDFVSGLPTPDRTAGELDTACGCYDGDGGGDADAGPGVVE